ncbi:MFS transporter [Mycolicibacterium baixiangningiae]|uniref:MFS transporter n=1 Tax=Mycolicibacterium baixiangningiae TaxID=2761578 RepID=UPI001E2B4BEF|nr:MFS transporter [Mycolicibacterium baixiangningiae]
MFRLADQRGAGPGKDFLENVRRRREVQPGETGGVHVGVLPEIGAGTDQSASWRTLFSRDYRKRTLASWAMWFCLLGGYYGLTTWIGKLLADSGFDVVKTVGYIVLMALWGIPGFLTAAYLIEVVGRKLCLVGFALCSAIAAFVYGSASGLTELIIAGSFLQFFFFGMFSSIFAYTPELFPTRARAIGMGSSTAAGRLGSIFGPVIVPIIIASSGTSIVFAASAVLFVTGSLIAIIFLPETRQTVLEDISR